MFFVHGSVHVNFLNNPVPKKSIKSTFNSSTRCTTYRPTKPTSFPILSSHLTHKHCSYLIWNLFVLRQTTFASPLGTQ